MIKKTVDRTIFTGCYSNREAKHLLEMLAQRLCQTAGVDTIQIARDCLTVERFGGNWWEIHLVPKSKRPVKKFYMTRGQMQEFLRGVVQGERSAKKNGCQVR